MPTSSQPTPEPGVPKTGSKTPQKNTVLLYSRPSTDHLPHNPENVRLINHLAAATAKLERAREALKKIFSTARSSSADYKKHLTDIWKICEDELTPPASEQVSVEQDPFQPDWSKAPEWAEWFAVNSQGWGYFWRKKPSPNGWGWKNKFGCEQEKRPRQYNLEGISHSTTLRRRPGKEKI